MSYRLNIPQSTETRLFFNESNLNKTAEFIGKLHVDDSFAAATRLVLELNTLNRQKVDVETRVNILEVYRNLAREITEQLSVYYAKSTTPLPPGAKKHAFTAAQLWQEIAYGYKIAFLDLQKKLFSFYLGKTNAYLVLRAIDALRRQCLVHYLNYTTPPETIWSDIHRLYAYALQHSFELIEIPRIKSSPINTVNAAYTQTLLMAALSPKNLPKDQILKASLYIKYLVKHAKIRAISQLKQSEGVFLVHLNSDKPPTLLTKAQQPDIKTDAYLITYKISHQLQQHLKMVDLGQAKFIDNATVLDLGSRDKDLLNYLIAQFGSIKTRAFARRARKETVQMSVGLNTALYLFEKNVDLDAPKNKISNWEMINVSATGYALRHSNPKNIAVTVGDLVTLKESAQTGWVVASVVWIQAEDDQLTIGLKLIAGQAEVVEIKSSRHNTAITALLLNEVLATQQPASIVAARGVLLPDQIIEAKYLGKNRIAAVDKLIERSVMYERYEFVLIDKHLS